MSQIETIMFVALGFVLAALVALLIGRVLWAFALRAGRRRDERDKPTDLARAQADRDRLRAEYAMLSRRLELRLHDLKTRLAEQTAEVSRNRNRIERLVEELEARDVALAAAAADLQEARAQLEPLEAELAHRTHGLQKLKEQLRDRDEAMTGLHQELAGSHAEIAARTRQVEALRAEPAGTGRPAAGDDGEAATAYDRLSRRIEELTLLSERIEAQRQDMSRQQEALKALKADIEAPDGSRTGTGKTPSPRGRKKPDRPVAVEAGSEAIASQSAGLEREIAPAERETADLGGQIRALDRVWNEKLAALGEAAPGKDAGMDTGGADHRAEGDGGALPDSGAEGDVPEPDEATNVISLASRIRALQRSIAE